jgi:hypothetical protein
LEVAEVGLRPLGYEQKEPMAAWDGWRVWITPDVNVPDALLAAQLDDRLVIFAGPECRSTRHRACLCSSRSLVESVRTLG